MYNLFYKLHIFIMHHYMHNNFFHQNTHNYHNLFINLKLYMNNLLHIMNNNLPIHLIHINQFLHIILYIIIFLIYSNLHQVFFYNQVNMKHKKQIFFLYQYLLFYLNHFKQHLFHYSILYLLNNLLVILYYYYQSILLQLHLHL